jgi:hypothetical protein
MRKYKFGLIALLLILTFSSIPNLIYSPSGFQVKMLPSNSSLNNPNVSCPSTPVVSIFDITNNQTELKSYNTSPFSPGITPPPSYSSALQLDGSASNTVSSSNTISVTLSTSKPNDVIYLAFGSSVAQSSTPSVKDSSGLSWKLRTHFGSSPYLATFAAIASSSLSGDNITVTAPVSGSLNVFVFGISGADTRSFAGAFDGSKSIPSHSSGTGSTLKTKISTTAYNDMLIGVGVQLNGPTLTAGSPFTIVGGASSKSLSSAVETQTVSTWQSGLKVNFSSSGKGAWVMIGDAVSRDGGPHGGGAKRWLTNALGNAPPGWVSQGPACTITNLKGTSQPSYVQIDNVKVTALKKSSDCTTSYDLINGGHSIGATYCDYVFNAYDPSINPSECTTASPLACYGIIHVEIDQDWQAAGYCSTSCTPSSLVKLIKYHPSAVIDIQGFVYWDPEEITAQAHSFSGWEIHPLTAWTCVSGCT